jgi:hypothetical protein
MVFVEFLEFICRLACLVKVFFSEETPEVLGLQNDIEKQK